MGSLENICCESSVGKAFNGSSRLDDIISGLLDNRDDVLLPINEEGLVREGVPACETYGYSKPFDYTPRVCYPQKYGPQT